jgi:polyhydroxyalkanoate synthesis regulator phasin
MVMVKDALRGYIALASGVTEVTAARARAAAKVLVEQGESTASQISTLAEDLLETSRRNREGLLLIVRNEVEATLRRLGLGAAGDVDALNQRVRRLEQALRESERSRKANASTNSSAAGEKRTAARKPIAKRSAATKATAKKSATSKSAAKTSTAKKSTVKKSPAKRAAAKRSTSKRTTRTRRSTGTFRGRSS